MTPTVSSPTPPADDVEPQDARLLNDETVTPVMEKMQIEELLPEEDRQPAEKFIEVDSLKSWLVALSCSWIMFWTLLINRTSG